MNSFIRMADSADASISGISLIGNLPDDQRANTGIVVHGARKVSIHDCEVKGFEFTGIWMHDAVESSIHHNRIEDVALLAFTGATNFRFINNIVVVKKDMPVFSLGKHGKESRGIQIVRNVFVKDGGAPMAADVIKADSAQPPAPGAIEIRDNHFWNWNPDGTNSRTDDPKLIREPDGDQLLKLAPDSPALKAGLGTLGGKLPVILK